MKGSHGRRAIVLVLLALGLTAGVVVAFWSWQRPSVAPRAAPDLILEHSKALLAAQETQPVPGWQSDGTASGRAGTIPEVRRAEPVVPRAQLVRLPVSRANFVQYAEPVAIASAHIDEAHDITMPYGTVVRATLRGFLEQENQLPQIGHIGDMYVVANTPWIWIRVPGTPAPTWVDP